MRGDTPGLEPRLSPQPFAQRRKLAEIRRPLDGAALKSQFLRGGVVVNLGMGIVNLGMQHLVRPPPRSREAFRRFGDDGFEG